MKIRFAIISILVAVLAGLFTPSTASALTVTQAWNQCYFDTVDSAEYLFRLYGTSRDFSDSYPPPSGQKLPPGVTPNKVSSTYIVVWIAHVADNKLGVTYYCHVKTASWGTYSSTVGTWWGPGRF